MTAHSFSDTAVETALSSGISAAATEIQVGSVSGFPITYPYYLDIDYGSVTLEVVEVTSGAGTTLTVTRGASTTSPIGHSSGAIVRHVAPAEHYESVEAHAEATSAVHGVAGTLVGTTDSQTLTGKTINSADNDLTVDQADVVGLVADLAAVDTLIDNHIADSSAAHAASAISFSPAGTIAATDVQAAIAEVDTDLSAIKVPTRCYTIQNSPQSIPDSTVTAVLFDTDTYDPLDMHSTASQLARVVVPTSGWYRVYGQWVSAGNVTGARNIYIYVNGAPVWQDRALSPGSFASVRAISCEIQLTAGDYVGLYVQQTSGGALSTAAGSALHVVRSGN